MTPHACLLALLVSAPAQGASPPAAPPENGADASRPSYEAVSVPVPAVSLDAKTDGKADLTLSGGVLLRPWSNWLLTPRLSLKSSTNEGLGTVFSVSSTKGDTTKSPWSLGAAVVLNWLPPQRRDLGVDEAKQYAYAACKSRCSDAPPAASKKFCDKRAQELDIDRQRWREKVARKMRAADLCKTVAEQAAFVDQEEAAKRLDAREALSRRAKLLAECTKGCDKPSSAEERDYCSQSRFEERPLEVNAIRFTEGDFCAEGDAVLREHRKKHPERITTNPPLTLKAGGQVGRSQLKNLSPDPAVPGQLLVDESRRTPWSIGAGLVRILGGGRTATIEGLLSYGRTFQASDTTAKWCVPAGTVSSDGVTAPAESCQELPLGITEKSATRLALYGGYLDQMASSWRAAGGLDLLLPRGGGHEISIAAPVWISFAGTGGKYLGIARIIPSITWVTDGEGKKSWRTTLAIALLGQPTLFSPEFDQL